MSTFLTGSSDFAQNTRARYYSSRVLVLAGAACVLAATMPDRVLAAPQGMSGCVVTDPDGQPVVNATVVSLAEAGVGAVSDSAGLFVLSTAAPRPLIAIRKSGFVGTTVFLDPRAGCLRVVRAGSIAGRIADEDGDPVEGAMVTLERSAGGLAASGMTNDYGVFRLGGLAPGHYRVKVSAMSLSRRRALQPRLGPLMATLYYPGTDHESNAEEVSVAPGSDLDGINLVMPSAIPMSSYLLVNATALVPTEQPLSTGVVKGIVLDDTGVALPHAFVRLLGWGTGDIAVSLVKTDPGGRFEFRGVPLGHYTLLGAKTGFDTVSSTVADGPAAGLPGMPTVSEPHGEGQNTLVLPRLSAMEGTVFDAKGEVVAGVEIQALRAVHTLGSDRLAMTGRSTQTDDRGRYRLHGLRPGEYVVSARVADAVRTTVQGPFQTYFPAAASLSEASQIQLSTGELRTGMDISIPSAKTAKITGLVVTSGGEQGQLHVTLNESPLAIKRTERSQGGREWPIQFRGRRPRTLHRSSLPRPF